MKKVMKKLIAGIITIAFVAMPVTAMAGETSHFTFTNVNAASITVEKERTDGITGLDEDFTFILTDASGNPVSGAEYYLCDEDGVSIDGITYTTGSDGSFQLKAGQQAWVCSLVDNDVYTVSEVFSPEQKKKYEEIDSQTVKARDTNSIVDKSALEHLIARGQNAFNYGTDYSYTEESLNNLKDALQVASNVVQDLSATNNDVNQAYDVLLSALSNMKFESGHYGVERNFLYPAYATYLKLKEHDYTPESWVNFANAIAEAEEVLDDFYATQEDVDQAYEDLRDAVEKLVYAEYPMGELIFTNEQLSTITINKMVSNAGNVPLEGAEFTIYNGNNAINTITTGSDGTLTFESLPEGTYTIKETKVPDGYMAVSDDITVTVPLVVPGDEVTDTTGGLYNSETDTYYFYDMSYDVYNIANTAVLPNAGGMRTLWGIIIGSAVVAAGITYAATENRRRNKQKIKTQK